MPDKKPTRDTIDPELRGKVHDAVRDGWVRREAQRELERAESRRAFRKPRKVDVGLLSDQFEQPRPKVKYLIDGLLRRKQNASMAGQYKTGKTLLGINEMAACVDGRPFLGRETHFNEGGRFGWMNGEMDRDDWLDYARPVGIERADLVAVMHLRGKRINLLDDVQAEYVVKWLKDNDVTDWRVDSWRKLVQWAGLSPNDNEGAGFLTDRIDQIKDQAGVRTFLVMAHTGRAQVAPGAEHVAGATELDNWVDARWLYVKEPDGSRFFYAEGRGVEFEEQRLLRDEATSRVDIGFGNRLAARADDLASKLEQIEKMVIDKPGINTSELKVMIRAKLGESNNNQQVSLIAQAKNDKRVHPHKKGTSMLYFRGEFCDECAEP